MHQDRRSHPSSPPLENTPTVSFFPANLRKMLRHDRLDGLQAILLISNDMFYMSAVLF